MPRFYFGYRQGALAISDELGIELATIEQAHAEAKAAFGDLAREASRVGAPDAPRELGIEVSDANRCPLFRSAVSFKDDPV